MTKLRQQIGENRQHFKVGFAHVYGGPQSLERNTRMAAQNNLSLGVIIALQTHSVNQIVATQAASDLRNYQWRMNGTSWAGKEGAERDFKVVTPSRYATKLHESYVSQAAANGREAAGIMGQYPGVIIAFNVCIEEELAKGGESDEGMLGDYSPFAIAEFRDWLRHTGAYDAITGPYKGQGAPAALVGQREIGGVMRSPFYDHPSPSNSNGMGPSFNETFGTDFSSWKLAYWDLDDNPNPIINHGICLMPQPGNPGSVPGGFDAPRQRNPKHPFWRVWSYDVGDQGWQQPPGWPAAPAFGFRQHLVKHFVADLAAAVISSGIPAEMVFAHQVPGEMVGAERCRSGAHPLWTARLDANGTLGSTRFGPYDCALADRYCSNWGIFEWHPLPNAQPHSKELYDAAIKALDGFFASSGYCFFPGWWIEGEGPAGGGTFPLNDSQFACAMRDWLAGHPDIPRPQACGI
ncbi:hypothetical protein WJX73_005223 [Symbiochloris irregularis]|uniref:Uncharacterized protein n=1 Tax=Symbiochloris irregularis TaxID=706552 RepID=A0AAW1PF43_9CHLO